MKNITLIFSILFMGCTQQTKHNYSISTYDVSASPECSEKVLAAKDGYVHMQGDDGSVMYVESSGGNICLKRPTSKKI